jgi:phospholipid-transporting ATPase
MIFEFTSEKKRMTVVIKIGKEYVLFCKGADEVLLEMIGECTHKDIIR